ncbi:membrane dipeptidase [Algibacter mikhailovii]|uniref:membrane dipeptidase n=1 Tax=Algibacter mikhailovii TaxID=425498 RepID=UPI0024940245|nr:membrane dipeptidase [Algibacter mikhailovii]
MKIVKILVLSIVIVACQNNQKDQSISSTRVKEKPRLERMKTDYSVPAIEMRERPTDPEEFTEYIDYLVRVAEPRTVEERNTDIEVMDKYKDALVVDALFVGGPGFPAGFTEDQYEEAVQHSIDNRYDFISATISNGPPEDTPEKVLERMQRVNDYWKQQDGRYKQVYNIEDVYEAKKNGQIAVMHNFQSMMPLGDDLSNIQKYYDLGLRQMNFTYNIDTKFADGGVSNDDGTDNGVTELGAKVIREMNRLGIVVDASHSSNKTAIEAAMLTDKPMMLSHSNLMTFQPIGRNVSDEAVKAVAATGGVICVNFIGGFLNSKGEARPYDIAKHLDYIKRLVGAECTCVGPDYVYNYAETLEWILNNPKNFPIEMGYATPSHMGKPGEIWGVVRELEATFGWTEDEVKGFLGGNLMRVYEANWE